MYNEVRFETDEYNNFINTPEHSSYLVRLLIQNGVAKDKSSAYKIIAIGTLCLLLFSFISVKLLAYGSKASIPSGKYLLNDPTAPPKLKTQYVQ